MTGIRLGPPVSDDVRSSKAVAVIIAGEGMVRIRGEGYHVAYDIDEFHDETTETMFVGLDVLMALRE